MNHYTGYHGTTKESSIEILKSGHFRDSLDENEWLGQGVYFFEDDIKQAYNFCVKARRYQSWAILRCDIEAAIVFDLTKVDDFQEFRRIANLIKERYTMVDKNNKRRRLLNSFILNTIYKIYPYDLVRHIFRIPQYRFIFGTNITAYQIQLCVRNKDCIKTIQEATYHEYPRVWQKGKKLYQ